MKSIKGDVYSAYIKLTEAGAVGFEEVEAAVSRLGGAGETNEHVHERRKELSWQEVATRCDKLVEAELSLRSPGGGRE